MDENEKAVNREIDRALAEAQNKIIAEEFKEEFREVLESEGTTFSGLMVEKGPSYEALQSFFEEQGVRVTSGSGSYQISGLKASRPFLQFGDLPDLHKVLQLFENLAIKAGEPDIFESVRGIFFSEGMVYKYDAILHEEGGDAYIHERRAISLDTTWVLEIDNYENIWRFTIRMPANHFEKLLRSL
jgi:hypothetical protein